VGLYIYDFKTHVSIGYTALEIRYLRESEAYRGGTAYEIYRATDGGGFELRGARDERLAAREALCFLRRDAVAAGDDYRALQQAAKRHPLPCPTELRLAEVDAFDPPHVTALLYPAAASHALAGWLNRSAFNGGDRAVGGIDAHAEVKAAQDAPIDKCDLPTVIDYQDRSAEEVLRTVDRPVQR
jgi:hypothetical protein